jgi:FSR family fosmidomycin resistance protein-like MFS transporter
MLREDSAPATLTDAAPGPAPVAAAATTPPASQTVYPVLFAISFCHALNDMMQALVPSIYPLLKDSFDLDFAQIGYITLTWQMTASLLQPIVGAAADKRPMPYSLAFGMIFTLAGLLMAAWAPSYALLLVAVGLIGTGSAIFHPESSRIARMASGGRFGLAQSIFQVGGNAGSAIGPLMAAFIILPYGQGAIGWFGVSALLAGLILFRIGTWYAERQMERAKRPARPVRDLGLSQRAIWISIGILVALSFSKSFYTTSISSFLQFYLIDRFAVDARTSQMFLFLFTGSVALGTFFGGPIGDRIGRKAVLWGSVLGCLPFTLALPYANLVWTGVLVALIGLILASTFSVIIVYAQELLPGKTGLVAGIFLGLAFGLSGVGAAVLGKLADITSIGFVFSVCSFLPAIGILVMFLPDIRNEVRS